MFRISLKSLSFPRSGQWFSPTSLTTYILENPYLSLKADSGFSTLSIGINLVNFVDFNWKYKLYNYELICFIWVLTVRGVLFTLRKSHCLLLSMQMDQCRRRRETSGENSEQYTGLGQISAAQPNKMEIKISSWWIQYKIYSTSTLHSLLHSSLAPNQTRCVSSDSESLLSSLCHIPNQTHHCQQVNL